MEARFLETTAEFLLNSLLSRLKISVKIIILSFSDNLRIKTNVFTCYNSSSVSYFEIIPLNYCSEFAWKQTQRSECTGYFFSSKQFLFSKIYNVRLPFGCAKNSVNRRWIFIKVTKGGNFLNKHPWVLLGRIKTTTTNAYALL